MATFIQKIFLPKSKITALNQKQEVLDLVSSNPIVHHAYMTKKGTVVAAALDGKLLSAEEAKALAEIPSKEEIYAKMLGSINSPATGIVGAINAVMASLTRAVAAVRDKKAA